MKINCIIVDDEPIARDILIRYIEQIPYLQLIRSCTDAFEAMDVLKKEDIDLVILDINMPRLTGFEMLRSLKKYPAVIITSAYPEYALEGFELSVVDYLLKPFSFARFVQATEKTIKPSPEHHPGAHAQNQGSPPGAPGVPGAPGGAGSPANAERPDNAFLMVKSDKKLTKVFFNEISFVEAYGNYIFIHRQSDKIISKQTLQEFENQLPPTRFVRIHKSFIVALDAIKYLEGNQVAIGDKKIPIGKVYRDNVLKRLQ